MSHAWYKQQHYSAILLHSAIKEMAMIDRFWQESFFYDTNKNPRIVHTLLTRIQIFPNFSCYTGIVDLYIDADYAWHKQ